MERDNVLKNLLVYLNKCKLGGLKKFSKLWLNLEETS